MNKKFLLILMPVILFFAGCSNFLSGSLLDESIKDKISRNNAKSVNVQFTCNPVYGSIMCSESGDLKVGYPVTVSFYKTLGFENNFIYNGFDSSDSANIKIEYLNESNNDYVSPNNEVTRVARITLLKKTENIEIFPSVTVKPKVISVVPDLTSGERLPINSSIHITFNKSLKTKDEDENGNEIDIVFSDIVKIKNSSEDEDITSYYSFTYYEDDKLNSYGTNSSYLTISVKEESIEKLAGKKVSTYSSGLKDSESIPVELNETFTYGNEPDSIAPVISSFEVQTDTDLFGFEKNGRSYRVLPSSIVSSLVENQSQCKAWESNLKLAYQDENTGESINEDSFSIGANFTVRLRAGDKATASGLADETRVKAIHWKLITHPDAQNKQSYSGVIDPYTVEKDEETGLCFKVNLNELTYDYLDEKGEKQKKKVVNCLKTVTDYIISFWAEDFCGNGSDPSDSTSIGTCMFRLSTSPFEKISENDTVNQEYWKESLLGLNMNTFVTVGDGSLYVETKVYDPYKNIVRVYEQNHPDTPVREEVVTYHWVTSEGTGSEIQHTKEVNCKFEGLENDKTYIVKISVTREDGSAPEENECWVTRQAAPTSGTNRYRVGMGGLTYAEEPQNFYAFDKYTDEENHYMSFANVPDMTVKQNGIPYTVRTTLWWNPNEEPSDSGNWIKLEINNNGDFKWPLNDSDGTEQKFYGMLKFEKIVNNSDIKPKETGTTTTDICYSKVFSMERGTKIAKLMFEQLGKSYSSGIIIDVYNNYDPSIPESEWFPPKTVWARYNQGSYSNSIDSCKSWISSNSNLSSSYTWRLPDSNELSLMWKFKNYISPSPSLPTDSNTSVRIPGYEGDEIIYTYWKRGTVAVNEGEIKEGWNASMYCAWPVATIPRPGYCPNCRKKYASQEGINSCKTKEGCAGWTTPCSVCGHKYHTTAEANACGLTKSCPGFKTPVATYQFHNTIELLPAGTDGSAGTTGKYVLFGDWPQTLCDSSVGVYEELDSITVGRFTYYLGADGNYYAKKNGNYYKVEPVKWRVITDNYQNTGNALLTAENILDSLNAYGGSDSGYYSRTIDGRKILCNDWEYSAPRALLNGLPLYKATSNTSYDTDSQYINNSMYQTMFDENGRSLIELTDAMYDSVYTGDADYNGRDTKDCLFILSYSELDTYSIGWNRTDNGKRTATGFCSSDHYFLRTQLSDWSVRIFKNENGKISNISAVFGSDDGIVPSMTVSSKTLFGDDYVSKDNFAMKINGVSNITPENNAFKFKVKTTNKAAKITVSYKKTSDSSYTTKDLTADADGFYEITGLSDGNIYDVKVKATDAIGQESSEYSGYKMMTAPAAPAIEEVGAWLDGTIPDGVNEIHWNKDSTRTSDYKYTIQYGRGVKYANPERISEYTDDSLLSFRLYKNSSLVKEVNCDSTNQFEIPLSSGVTPGNYTYSISSVLKVGKNYIEGPKRTFTFHETCCDLAYVALLFSYYSSNNEYILVNSCAVYKAAPTVSTPLNIVAWDKNNGSSTGTLSNSGSTSQYSYTSNGYYSYVRTDYCMSPESFFKYKVYSSNSSVTPLYTFTFTQKTAPQSDTTYEIKKSEVNLQFVW